MQIDIDFQVFKALTSLRESESDSYNAVIRRLLSLEGAGETLGGLASLQPSSLPEGGLNTLTEAALRPGKRGLFGNPVKSNIAPDESLGGILSRYLGGVWFGNVHFPEGTKFRATYKGQTHYAEIKDGHWVGSDGLTRRSPSDAASAISNTNVNGWRFWHVQLPGDPGWRKLEELKQ
jgi:hypothetical protein